jgi:hypothetical protein
MLKVKAYSTPGKVTLVIVGVSVTEFENISPKQKFIAKSSIFMFAADSAHNTVIYLLPLHYNVKINTKKLQFL